MEKQDKIFFKYIVSNKLPSLSICDWLLDNLPLTKFIEVESLEKKNIGFPIKNGNEFKLIKNRIFKNRDTGKGGYEFIKSKSGATNKINEFLKHYLKWKVL